LPRLNFESCCSVTALRALLVFQEMLMFPRYSASTSPAALALAAILALSLTACGGKQEPSPAASVPAAEPTAPDAAADTAASAEDEAAALAAREQELADQEAAMALREREAELARREAELAAREAAVKAPARTTTPPKTAATPRPATSTPSAAPAAPAPLPPPVTVPTGTQFTVELTSPLSTKTSLADDTVEARLASDLTVGSRRVASAGSMVRGSVREVTSGSKKIGAVPALRIDFNQLVVADGSTLAINASAVQKGQSEKGRDTAKIVGGTAAGAIIGHQIDDDKGKVIGGVIGAAAGAIAAQKTGTEVELPTGSTLTATTQADFEYAGR
jgi:hypothetical protein